MRRIAVLKIMGHLDPVAEKILSDLMDEHPDIETHIRAIEIKKNMPKTMGKKDKDNGK